MRIVRYFLSRVIMLNSLITLSYFHIYSLKISDHFGKIFSSRIIWFGDLNYRISLSRDDAKRLVEMKDWPALFNKDQVVSFPCQ